MPLLPGPGQGLRHQRCALEATGGRILPPHLSFSALAPGSHCPTAVRVPASLTSDDNARQRPQRQQSGPELSRPPRSHPVRRPSLRARATASLAPAAAFPAAGGEGTGGEGTRWVGHSGAGQVLVLYRTQKQLCQRTAAQVRACVWSVLLLVTVKRLLGLFGMVSAGPRGSLQHEVRSEIMLQRRPLLSMLCVICVEHCDYLQMAL